MLTFKCRQSVQLSAVGQCTLAAVILTNVPTLLNGIVNLALIQIMMRILLGLRLESYFG